MSDTAAVWDLAGVAAALERPYGHRCESVVDSIVFG
jgi:hypothetical protein